MKENINYKRVIEMDEETLLVFLESMYQRIRKEVKNEPIWISAKDACKLLNCGATKLWEIKSSGLVEFAKLNRKILYKRTSILRYIESQSFKTM